MKVFLIDIRTGANEEYEFYTDILKDYFKKHKIEYFILKENKHKVHPSWLKLKCFDYIDDDFVLCWDVDLLPKQDTPSIVPALDLNKINLAVDTTLILKNQPKYIPEFKYNCGLFGIPRSYKDKMTEIFEANKESKWPSWEQYHVNKFLAENNYKDVHELDKTWNCQWHLPTYPNQFILSAKAVHFTGPGLDRSFKRSLVKKYHGLYFKNR